MNETPKNEKKGPFEEAEHDTQDYVPRPDETDEVECEDLDLDLDLEKDKE